MSLLIDTNILLDYPQILQDYEQGDLVILTDVLKELDGLKQSANAETAFKARRAAVVISRNLNRLNWDDSLEEQKMPVDQKLLTAAKNTGNTLITNDVYLKIKATLKGINTHGYSGFEDYTGIRTIKLATNDKHFHPELEYILENHKLLDEQRPLREGEYVIIKDLSSPIKTKHGDDDYEVLYIGVNVKGKIVDLKQYQNVIQNSWINKIVPLNSEQSCLFHALNNQDKTIVYAGGKFGTGKSFILNNYAMQEFERGHIDKIVYVPNNSYTENTTDLGALPGELLEKTVGLIGPLLDLIGIDQITSMMNTNQLEIVPINYIRGRSFKNSIVIVNEAQNLTEDHVKLLIARCGDGTRIFFDGDIKQADSAIFRNKNGLKLLTALSSSSIYADLFAMIKLTTIERSKTANAASFIDDITGNI